MPMVEPGRPKVFPDIVEEHLDELDFLWELREGVVFAPDWTLAELGEHEARAEAHLDGLRLAEQHAVDHALERLWEGETFVAAAAALLLAEHVGEGTGSVLLEALGGEEPSVREGVRIGMRHARGVDALVEPLCELVRSAEPAAAAAAADVLAFHRRGLPDVARLLCADDPHLRVLAYGAAGRAGRLGDRRALRSALEDPDSGVRRAALEGSIRCGADGLTDLCRAAAIRAGDPDPVAVEWLGVLVDPEHEALLLQALGRPELAAAALRGLGALGRPSAVEPLLDCLADERLGAIAAAALRRITGSEELYGERRPIAIGGPDDDDESDSHPPPDPDRARAWWSAHGAAFDLDRRWLNGHPAPVTADARAIDALPLESRRDAYLGLRATPSSGVPDLELEARAVVQRSGSRSGV